MKAEELSFFNLQLAGMLKSGLPLEGALAELTSNLREGKLRRELEQVQSALASGTPLAEALSARALPVFYVQMVRLGARGGNLAGILTWVADYYLRLHQLTVRVQGMMVYPSIVLVAALALSIGIVYFQQYLIELFGQTFPGQTRHLGVAFLWMPPLVLAGMGLAALAAYLVPSLRSTVRWALPGFKETALTQLASSMATLLRGGMSMQEAVDFLQTLETDPLLKAELASWKGQLAAGHGKFDRVVGPKSLIPPLFVWMVANAGEDLTVGFERAASLYQSRAAYRHEMFLYAFLPVVVLMLGLLIFGQVLTLGKILSQFNEYLMDTGDGGGAGDM